MKRNEINNDMEKIIRFWNLNISLVWMYLLLIENLLLMNTYINYFLLFIRWMIF